MLLPLRGKGAANGLDYRGTHAERQYDCPAAPTDWSRKEPIRMLPDSGSEYALAYLGDLASMPPRPLDWADEAARKSCFRSLSGPHLRHGWRSSFVQRTGQP